MKLLIGMLLKHLFHDTNDFLKIETFVKELRRIDC
jgi:hypothetical protein